LQNLTNEEEVVVEHLMKNKYQTWEWNYGNSPNYSMNKKIRTKGGTVQVVADIQKGIIRDLRFYGDFFSEDDVQNLVNQLIGVSINRDELSQKLQSINVNRYFNNVTAEDLLTLFTH